MSENDPETKHQSSVEESIVFKAKESKDVHVAKLISAFFNVTSTVCAAFLPQGQTIN